MGLERHYLYDNWMYYQMSSEDIKSMLQSQDELINRPESHGKHLDEACYKRDCLLFELHRRSFHNCMIQMSSVCKVRGWFLRIKPQKRCKCCKLEFYEFYADLDRVERLGLKCSKRMAKLLAANAFAGGRTLGCMRNDYVPANPESSLSIMEFSGPHIPYSLTYMNIEEDEAPSDMDPFDPNTFSSSSSNLSSSSSSSHAHNYVIEENTVPKPIPAPRLSKMVSLTSFNNIPTNSNNSVEENDQVAPQIIKKVSFALNDSNEETQHSEEEPKDQITPKSILKCTKSSVISSESPRKSFKNMIMEALPFHSSRKRYVTFNLRDNADYPIQYSFGPADGKSSTEDKTTEEKESAGNKASLELFK